jgi:hypothetical protein
MQNLKIKIKLFCFKPRLVLMRVAADSEESFDRVDRTYDFICLLQSTQLLTSWPFKQL